jgi:hypothetical protein
VQGRQTSRGIPEPLLEGLLTCLSSLDQAFAIVAGVELGRDGGERVLQWVEMTAAIICREI